MSLPPPTRAKDANRLITETRRAPAPAGPPRRLSLTVWPIAGLALLLGLGSGVLVMRHRHAAQTNIAAVNGVLITQDQLFLRLQEAQGPATMHKLVEEELQIQFAKKKGLAPTDADVAQKYEQAVKDPKFLPMLAASNISVGDYKRSLKVKLSQANVLTQGVTVSEDEIRQFYNAQVDPHNPNAQYYTPDAISLRAIAVTSQPDAARVMQELNANTPFEMAATEFSQDSSKQNGGLLQPLQRGRSPLSQTPDLENAIFNLKVRQLYGPVQFNKAWWIFRCEEKAPGQAKPYDAVKEDCRLAALVQKGTQQKGAAVQAEFQQFQRSSNLQSFWPQYQQAVTGQ